MNDGALKAGKKLYIYLYVARAQHVTACEKHRDQNGMGMHHLN
jgi:hypothetical protein